MRHPSARMAGLLLAAALFLPGVAPAATEAEARTLMESFKARFSWVEQPEILAALLEGDARIAFHKLRENRPLVATDPEWQKHYAGFRKEYTEAIMKTIPPRALQPTPEGEKRVRDALVKEFSSADARAVQALLASDELKAAVADPKFQITWARLSAIYPRFRETELPVIFTREEISALFQDNDALQKRYPTAYEALIPSGAATPGALRRLATILGSLAAPGMATVPDEEAKQAAARAASALHEVIVKWRKIVG
jgi:hypothetical protein